MSSEDNAELKKPKALLGVRHFQAFMLFLGMVLIYSIRVCMSMAIVAMTDDTNVNTFTWNLQIQSVILSSFNWGYVLLQIPGGELAARFGGMALLTCCVGVNSVVALLIPVSACYGGWQSVCACRVVQGATQGFLNPSMHNLMSKWVPEEERSRLGTIIYAGSHLGTALQLITSGFISDAWGWQSIFYVNGSLGVAWTVLYLFLGSNSPKTSKIISIEEQLYIEKSLGQKGEQKRLSTPWKALFTSLPFISVIAAHAGAGFGYWTLLYEMPTYQHKVLGVNLKANGMMSALPYLVAYITSFAFGFASDYVLKKKWLSTTTCRKVSNSCGTYCPAIALIVMASSPPSVTTAIVVLTVAFGFKSGTFTGFNLVPLDMAPNFAGTMIGISGSICNIVSLNAPLVAGALVHDDGDPKEWRKVFYLASGVYIATNTFFVIFGTSERQKWNESDKDKNSKDANLEEEAEHIL